MEGSLGHDTNPPPIPARFDDSTIIDGADFSDVIIRKDINAKLCKLAKGTNEKTGVVTSESLNC